MHHRLFVLSVLMSQSCWSPFVTSLYNRCSFSVCDVPNRSFKWMEAEDTADNGALCLSAIRYINVPLITACVSVCVNQAQRVLMIPCCALVPRLSHLGACIRCVFIQGSKHILF